MTATDADKNENADVTYSLLTEWGNEVFSLNPASGIFTLTSSLDYEKTEHYMFVVSGTDHGEPQLSSTVTVYINVKVLLSCDLDFTLFKPLKQSMFVQI